MTEPQITPALIAKHGLTPDEYARIQTILGREPNFTELGIFSVMWSEHCSYKNSKRELRKFPTTGPTVLVKAGEENAGVIDIGDGWGIAFREGATRKRAFDGLASVRFNSWHEHHHRTAAGCGEAPCGAA